ncbi:MAG: HD family phosphohydrolase [bacterium]|nr:MAG: HD family phosphohydrolase [bacterium]
MSTREENDKKKNPAVSAQKAVFGLERGGIAKKRQDENILSSSDKMFFTLFGLSVLLLSLLLFAPSSGIAPEEFTEGEVSHRNVYAPEDTLVEDTFSTERNRELAYESVHDIYDLDLYFLKNLSGKINRAFELMKQGYEKNVPKSYEFVLAELEGTELVKLGDGSDKQSEIRKGHYNAILKYELSETFLKNEKKFVETLGIKLSENTMKVLKWHHYKPQIAGWLNDILDDLLHSGITPNKEFLPATSVKGITIMVVHAADTGKNKTPVKLNMVFDMKDAVFFIRTRVSYLVSTQYPSLRRGVIKILQALIRPNLTYNKARTIEIKNEARDAVSPVFLQVKKGELIVRKGVKTTSEHLLKLEKISAKLSGGSRFESITGLLLFLMLALGAAWLYIYRFLPDFVKDRSNVVLLGLIFLGQAALFRLFGAGAEVFATQKPGLELSSFLYAAPYGVAPLLAAIFFSREITALVALLTALSSGIFFHPLNKYLMIAAACGIIAVFYQGRIKRRREIWHVGFVFMLTNISVIAMGNLLGNVTFIPIGLDNMIFGVLGSFLVVALTHTFQPLIEMYFPVASNIKLLELQDLNHTLLAKMAVVAPGTYHHSVIVGNLAEGAAEAIGANPLMARVGSYFHDIGKLEKPEYFIENQLDGENKHNALNPSMSAIVIISHVTRGLDLAKEYKLIPQIQDIIAEHHGTQLLRIFYQRAKDQEKPGSAAVNEADFRYAGRTPRTRESAIVALADSVEAASRSLKNPTSSRLRRLVFKMINDKFLSGQLEDSHLTLRDLKKIGDSFEHILHGIFHYRVRYPDEKFDDDTDVDGEAWNQNAEPHKDKKKTSANIRRIG